MNILQIEARPDAEQIYHALSVLNVPGGKVREYLEANLEMLRAQNDEGEGRELHQRQGACQFIQQMLDQITVARDALESLQARKAHNPPPATNWGVQL